MPANSSDNNPVLVYSPVLNFIQSNLLIAAEDVVIKRHGMELFDIISVKVAKTLLWQLCLGRKDCPIRNILPYTAAYTSLFSKFNELHQVVSGMSSKVDNYKGSFPQLPRPALQQPIVCNNPILASKLSIPDITLKLEILQYSLCAPIPSPPSYPIFFSLILWEYLFSLYVFLFILILPYLIYVSCG